MLCKLTKEYIKKRANESNLSIPIDYEIILNQYCKIVEGFGHKLEFSEKRNIAKDILNSNAGLFKNSIIIASPEWAAQLVLYNTEESHNAFLIAIGHELTHKDCDIFFFKYGPFFMKFIGYVNELHADFGAAEKMVNSSRQKLLDSMEYKKIQKIKARGNDKSDPTHPTWAQRIYYVEHYDFGEELIRQIAKDTGCKNQKIIDKVCEHYQDIKLTPPPKKI